MSRSRSLALITAAALTAALAPAALASAAAPATADPGRAEHDRIVAYWTPERMKAAKPRDFVRQKDGSFTLAPTPKAARGKPGGLIFPADPGISLPWPVGQSNAPVQASTGKVYFRFGRSGYVCSGAVVEDGSTTGTGALVLTAAHCAYDFRKGFATYWMFIPDFDANPELNTSTCSVGGRYGCWTAEALAVHRGYVSAGSFNTQATNHDFAFAVVGSGGKSGEEEVLDRVVGSYRLATRSVTMSAFGYPAGDPFDGSVLTYCSDVTFEDPYSRGTTWGLPCDMTGGSSGGPWFDDQLSLDHGTGGAIGSLNSYGYSGYRFMFGPKFDDRTSAVHGVAKQMSANNSQENAIVG